MKKYTKVIITLLALFLGLSLLPAGTAGTAGEVVRNEDIKEAAGKLEIPRNTTVNGNVTLNLGELTVFGIVNGNVASNMGQINIIGDVNGDVEADMGQIVISGRVSGDVQAHMGEVVVDGSVGGNLFADLGAVKVSGGIGGNINSGFGELLIDGTVAGDVNSKGGDIIINGIVEGDVVLEQGLVELGPKAIVSGRIFVGRGLVKKAESALVGSVEIGEEPVATGLQDAEGVEGYRFEGIDGNFVDNIVEQVGGSLVRAFRNISYMPHMSRTRDWVFWPYPVIGFYGNIARGFVNILIMFALAVLTYALFPAQVKAAGSAFITKTGPVVGLGLLAAFLAIPLMILLAITIIGIPLILVEIIFLAAALILGYTGLANLVGSRIVTTASAKAEVNPFGAIALGVLILGLIRMIPLIGLLITLVVYILAIGAALATLFGISRPAAPEAESQ